MTLATPRLKPIRMAALAAAAALACAATQAAPLKIALVETLSGEGPFTVFAPTNEAFAKLPPAELQRLLKPANRDELAKILTYHVVSGDVMAADLSNGQKVKTVEGQEITVTIDGDTVKLNDTATVVQADIETSNGTVHVIDGVLLPPN